MVILQQIKQMKKENQGDNRLAGLVEEFYNEALPHKQQYISQDLDPQTISQKLDLCQVLWFHLFSWVPIFDYFTCLIEGNLCNRLPVTSRYEFKMFVFFLGCVTSG